MRSSKSEEMMITCNGSLSKKKYKKTMEKLKCRLDARVKKLIRTKA